jgi:tRNA pseudouridine38-40 synthase
VQAVVEDALSAIEGRAVTLVGAGRTDAGVHALAQVASAAVATMLAPATLRRAINVRLPEDVRVTHVADAPPGFDARRDATAKTYHYALALGPDPSPFLRRVVWHVPQRLDVDAMARAAALLVGRHDFAAFQASGGDVATTTRTLWVSELVVGRDFRPAAASGPSLTRTDPPLLRYHVTGSGFLRHMVRNIVGTLVDIGKRRWPPDEMAAILASATRTRAGATAPAHGLVLVRVHYGRGIGGSRAGRD